MMQYRKSDPGRRRAVKRDRIGTACKGVAGIRPTVLQAMGDENRPGSPNDVYRRIEEVFGRLSLNDNVQLYIHVDSDGSEDEGDDDEGYD